jgi:hypothetical protein
MRLSKSEEEQQLLKRSAEIIDNGFLPAVGITARIVIFLPPLRTSVIGVLGCNRFSQ